MQNVRMGGCLLVCCNNPSRSQNIGVIGPSSRGLVAGLVTYIQTLFGDSRKNRVRTMGEENVASLIGSPALNQLVDKVFSLKTFTILIRTSSLFFSLLLGSQTQRKRKC